MQHIELTSTKYIVYNFTIVIYFVLVNSKRILNDLILYINHLVFFFSNRTNTILVYCEQLYNILYYSYNSNLIVLLIQITRNLVRSSDKTSRSYII